jgi:hypothetical protein
VLVGWEKSMGEISPRSLAELKVLRSWDMRISIGGIGLCYVRGCVSGSVLHSGLWVNV